MNIFRRLFRIGQAEAHSAVDKMEDPIKLTEQGIREMKEDLSKALEGLAQVKAMLIRSQNDKVEFESKVQDYQSKAVLILQKVKNEELSIEEGDRLAKESLIKKEENQSHAVRCSSEADKYAESVAKLEKNVNQLKSNISKWENELKTLKARVKVSNATKNLNKTLASIDSDSTVNMLERMKEKVEQEEALAEAYGNIAEESKSIDEEIDKVLDSKDTNAESDLEALKKQMGLND